MRKSWSRSMSHSTGRNLGGGSMIEIEGGDGGLLRAIPYLSLATRSTEIQGINLAKVWRQEQVKALFFSLQARMTL